MVTSEHVTANRGAHTLDKPQIALSNTAVGVALEICQCNQNDDMLLALSSDLIGTVRTQSVSNFSLPQRPPQGRNLIYIRRSERSQQ